MLRSFLFGIQSHRHVLLHLFFFIIPLTEIAANIAVAMANSSSFSLLWNGKPAPREASDAMFLVPVSCTSGVHNLDPSFWYEILVPELGRRTWIVCHRPYCPYVYAIPDPNPMPVTSTKCLVDMHC